ncbi:MAG: ThiF family adenylyltransferase [Ginsengibacter sp.]
MDALERYSRQISLKEFGEAGQKRLAAAKVFIAGAGGLGCPVLLYLAAAGVGTLGVADDDVVSLNNLHRQVLFSTDDIGKLKVEAASEKVRLLNPEVKFVSFAEKLTNQNALEILKDFDIVIDGTDNFPSKYMINDACVLLDKPLIYGSVSKFEGQVAVFNLPDAEGKKCNYRDLFPQPPHERIFSCAEEGVLGTTTGIIGSMQANEAIKIITGIGKPLINQLMIFNALTNESFILGISKNQKDYQLPADENEFKKTDYDWLCSVNSNVEEIDQFRFNELLNEKEVTFIDVRELDEKPDVDFDHERIPLGELRDKLKDISTKEIVCFCQTGKRSVEAARILSEKFGESKKIYSLKGGVLSLPG